MCSDECLAFGRCRIDGGCQDDERVCRPFLQIMVLLYIEIKIGDFACICFQILGNLDLEFAIRPSTNDYSLLPTFNWTSRIGGRNLV
jgi:hypothetical protein